LSKDSSSDGCFATASVWLNQCYEAHSCPKSISPLPTRVIDVGDDATEPRLHVSNGQIAPWLTLSHCWGRSRPIVTTKENVESHCQVLKLSTLPRTFQDAVIITRRLGHRYLWIDSLCIIQDSLEDWEAESSKMASVYHLGLLNIAAESSRNDSDGIFRSAGRARGLPQRIQLPCRSISHNLKGYVYAQSRYSQSVSEESPLDRRAWVLQEKALSPRILSYGSSGMRWGCVKTAHTEELPGFAASRAYNPLQQVGLTDSSNTPQYSSNAWWYQQLNEYCGRLLTYKKDRLPAIGGLARKFAQRTGYQYKAGIWVDIFREGLLWDNEGHEIDIRIAPSWSWASIDSKDRPARNVYPNKLWLKGWWEADKNKPRTVWDVELVDISVGSKNGDPFGQVVSGTLTLRGWYQTLPEPTTWRELWRNHQQGRNRGPPLHIQLSKPPKQVLEEADPQPRGLPNNSTDDSIICIHISNNRHIIDGLVTRTEFVSHSLMLHPHGDGTYFRIAHVMADRAPDDNSSPAEDGWVMRTIKIR
jgi:hypothetical protein